MQTKKVTILFTGNAGEGISTILNTVYNNAVDYDSLRKPALTSNSGNQCTTKIKDYENDKHILIDTPGFGMSDKLDESLMCELEEKFKVTKIYTAFIIFKLGFIVNPGTILKLAKLLHKYKINISVIVNDADAISNINEYFEQNEKDSFIKEMIKIVPKLNWITTSFSSFSEEFESEFSGLKDSREKVRKTSLDLVIGKIPKIKD